MGRDLKDYSYDLPPELIAQVPAEVRSCSRLLRLGRESGLVRHGGFYDLPDLLQEGDLLVVNDVAVFPARLHARRRSGGKVEVFLLAYPGCSEPTPCLVKPARKIADGEILLLEEGTRLTVDRRENGFAVTAPGGDLAQIAARLGSVPLPPYIRRPDGAGSAGDRERYQTVYARSPGAVAAPTAGLHFDDKLLSRLRSLGVEIRSVTLNVGPGTFQPVRVDDITAHRMGLENYEIPAETAAAVNRALKDGHRVVAVGTTVVRTLEAAAAEGEVVPGPGSTDLFIYPGFRFQVVDALLTNFHLPASTLLMLVCAFAGTEKVLAAYKEAVDKEYRFYSYGDAMFIE
jgi:S-adenosylmethionine:tRNA ribosyltransferase-isomerase